MMNPAVLQAAIHVPATIAYEAMKATTLKVSASVFDTVNAHINLNKVIIITAIALSCLATLSSLVYGYMLSLSLSGALLAASCLCYSINSELVEKTKECKGLHSFIASEDRIKQERLEEQERMGLSISKLDLLLKQQEAVNRDLQSRLSRALELVEFCNKAVTQAAEFSRKAATFEGEHHDVLAQTKAVLSEHRAIVEEAKATGHAHKAGLDEFRAIHAELQSYKEVLGVWIQDIRRMLSSDGEVERSTDKVIRILDDFSKGQHLELARMLSQLKEMQQQIEASGSVIKDQQQTLRNISSDIMKRTAELHEIHLKLASLHLELIRKGGASEVSLTILDPQEE